MTDGITKSKFNQFQAIEGAEITGVAVLMMANNLEEKESRPIMEKYGIKLDGIDATGWYPQGLINDITREIHDVHGFGALVAMGKASAHYIYDETLDSNIDDFGTFLESWTQGMTSNYRKLPPEIEILCEKKGENHYHIVNNVTQSNDVLYGFLWEMMNLYCKQTSEEYIVEPIYGYGTDEGATFELKWGTAIE